MATGRMQRFYDQEGQYVSIEELIDWVRAHPLGDGRILPIIIWGGFGVGKCVHGDTPVWINGQERAISSLWDDFSTSSVPDPTGGQWSVPREELETFSIDSAGVILDGHITKLFRQRVQETGRRVVLENGFSVTMTKRHRLLTEDGWEKDLKFGQQVAISSAPQIGCMPELSPISYIEDVRLEGYVYDLEVDGHHSYLAGGIISHNTQQIKAYGRKRNMEIRTYHPAHDVNGADIVGKAYRSQESGDTEYALPAWLPREDGSDPEEGLLFIDELNRAPEEVLAGLMEPLGEGTIAQSGWRLPKGWNIIAAANPSEMGYMVHELDEAMVDRMIHYAPGWDARYWGAWAEGADISQEIINFALEHQGTLVSTGEAQLPLEIENKLRTTPRTLEYMGALYEPGMPEGLLRVCTDGLMGREPGATFREMLLREDAPLSGEEILAEPQDTGSGLLYPYDNKVRAWAQDQIKGEPLIQASSERLVIHMLAQTPSSDDPRENRPASLAGRYLAFVPVHLREAALDSFARSAPSWLPAIKTAILGWTKALAEQQQVYTRREAARPVTDVLPGQHTSALPEGVAGDMSQEGIGALPEVEPIPEAAFMPGAENIPEATSMPGAENIPEATSMPGADPMPAAEPVAETGAPFAAGSAPGGFEGASSADIHSTQDYGLSQEDTPAYPSLEGDNPGISSSPAPEDPDTFA